MEVFITSEKSNYVISLKEGKMETLLLTFWSKCTKCVIVKAAWEKIRQIPLNQTQLNTVDASKQWNTKIHSIKVYIS